jgi:hypothetical protein
MYRLQTLNPDWNAMAAADGAWADFNVCFRFRRNVQSAQKSCFLGNTA